MSNIGCTRGVGARYIESKSWIMYPTVADDNAGGTVSEGAIIAPSIYRDVRLVILRAMSGLTQLVACSENPFDQSSASYSFLYAEVSEPGGCENKEFWEPR